MKDLLESSLDTKIVNIDFEPQSFFSKKRGFVGIDNGVSGSIGVLYEDGTTEFFITPTRKELNYTKAKSYITRIQPVILRFLLSSLGATSHVMIERPMVNPSRFVATVSALRAYEATITVLETMGLSYEVVDSKNWQKELLPHGCKGDELKSASLSVGNRLFPHTATSKHPDRDGILIAQHCKNKHK